MLPANSEGGVRAVEGVPQPLQGRAGGVAGGVSSQDPSGTLAAGSCVLCVCFFFCVCFVPFLTTTIVIGLAATVMPCAHKFASAAPPRTRVAAI